MRSIWQRDKGRCWICGHKMPLDQASRDHVQPRSQQGYDKSRNYRLAHRDCNSARGTLSHAKVRELVEPLSGRSRFVIIEALRAETSRHVRRG